MTLKLKYSLLIISVSILSASCKSADINPIETVLASEHPKIKTVVSNLQNHDVQILFTEVNTSNTGNISFTDYDFQVDKDFYFYPASTVKFPIAILALEKLNESPKYNKDHAFKFKDDDISTTFKESIQHIFAVSDNAAYNRLFEYLGQDDINKRLRSKGITARISHRVSMPNSDKITTEPFFIIKDSVVVDTIKPIQNTTVKALTLKHILKGKGYIKGYELVNSPMDFSKKNYLPLASLHTMMKRLVFPKQFKAEERFKISEEDRQFILNSMKLKPKALGYDEKEYYDSYVKFLVFGDTKTPMPNTIEIYNKVGYAYGTLTDCAYIKDLKNSKDYIITITIKVNENEIFNDDTYEYETVGIPFIAEFGRQIIRFN